MNRKQLEKQHIAHYFMSFAIIVLAAYSLSFIRLRFDLTSEKRYTLSTVSKDILTNLDDVVFVKIYLEGDLNASFKRFQSSIGELLDEFRVYGKDNLQYEFVNPSENPNAETRNAFYNDLYNKGLKPTNIHEKDKEGKSMQKIVFPGAILNCGEREAAVNLLLNNPLKSAEENLNNSTQALEYQLVNAIQKLTAAKDKTIAFTEGNGELDEYEVGDITEELSAFYTIHRIKINGQVDLLKNYSTLIIAKPDQSFSEKDKFAIDQFIMNGGKVLWLIDPVEVNMDSLSYSSSTYAYIRELNLDDQLFRYGVRIKPDLIEDIKCAFIPVNAAAAGSQPKFTPAPWFYYPLLEPSGMHPLTKNLNYVKAEFASIIDTVGGNGRIKKTFLLRSSEYTKKMKTPAMISLGQISSNPDFREFANPYQSVAVLLEGKFESVFKNRMITEIMGNKDVVFKGESLETKMIVIADGDIIKNYISVKPDGVVITPLGYDRYTQQTYGNKEFIVNAINYLNDEKGLMGVRSRELALRLLDKNNILNNRLTWQLVNTLLPVLLIVLSGILINYFRRRKYT